MKEYKIVYRRSDNSCGEETICAANRIAAFEIFESFGIEGIVAIDCFLVVER